MRANLITMQGKPVLTESVEIPDFTQWPDVLLWGDRAFIQQPADNPNDRKERTYAEGFLYWITPQVSTEELPRKPAAEELAQNQTAAAARYAADEGID